MTWAGLPPASAVPPQASLPPPAVAADVSARSSSARTAVKMVACRSAGEDNLAALRVSLPSRDAFDVLISWERLTTRAGLPACPRPTAPPRFSGAASGQVGPKAGGSSAGLGMHTAVSSSVFSLPAHPKGPTSLGVLLTVFSALLSCLSTRERDSPCRRW